MLISLGCVGETLGTCFGDLLGFCLNRFGTFGGLLWEVVDSLWEAFGDRKIMKDLQ